MGKKTEKAGQAQALLDSELLQQTFAGLRAEYIDAWQRTSVKEIDGRERLWAAVNIIGKVQDHLRKLIDDGKLASRDLAQIKTLQRK